MSRQAMPTVVGPRYFAFVESLCWLLDHHGIEHRVRPYVPIVGAFLLNARKGRLRSSVNLPVYYDEDVTLDVFFDAACYIDRRGDQRPLVPEDRKNEIEELCGVARLVMGDAFPLALAALTGDEEALRERLPSWARGLLATGLVEVGRLRWRYVRRFRVKDEASRAEHRAALLERLGTLRDRLGGRDYVYDELTFADLLIATVVAVVSPPPDPYFPLGPHNRRCLTQPELVDELGDLLTWRDEIYRKHRHALGFSSSKAQA